MNSLLHRLSLLHKLQQLNFYLHYKSLRSRDWHSATDALGTLPEHPLRLHHGSPFFYSITCIIFPFCTLYTIVLPPPLPLYLLLPTFWCTEVSLKPRPQVGGDAPVSPPQLRLQPPLSCSILFSRFVVSRKKNVTRNSSLDPSLSCLMIVVIREPQSCNKASNLCLSLVYYKALPYIIVDLHGYCHC